MPFFPHPERMIFLKHPLREETSYKHNTPAGNAQVAFLSPCCHHKGEPDYCLFYQICEDKNSNFFLQQFKTESMSQGCVLAVLHLPEVPYYLYYWATRKSQFFIYKITRWPPWIAQVQSTGPHIFVLEQSFDVLLSCCDPVTI